MNSLEQRLHLSLAISLIGLMGLLGVLQFIVVERLTETFITSRLEHDATALLAAIRFNTSGELRLDETRVGAIYTQPFSGHYYQIVLAEGPPLRSRSLWDITLKAAPLPPGATHHWQTEGPAGQTLLLWAGSYLKQKRLLTLVVAEDLSPLRQQLWIYSGLFSGMAVVFILVLLLVQHRIVQRSLQPLHKLREEIHRLEKGEIEQLSEEVPLEVRPLVSEVNRLLALMSQRLQRSRNSLGNLAHALKGPLNLLTQLAESSQLKQQPEIHQELSEHTERMRQLIEHELKRARLAGSGRPGQYFTPSEELPILVDLLKRIYKEKSLQIESHYPDGAMAGTDRDDMLELLGNLLDNACKWANSRVVCTITRDWDISICVEDDGPGITPDQLTLISQRGSRIDEAIPGHGLGLAIVREISDLYGASLRFDHSPSLGGLRVQITLPSGQPLIT